MANLCGGETKPWSLPRWIGITISPADTTGKPTGHYTFGSGRKLAKPRAKRRLELWLQRRWHAPDPGIPRILLYSPCFLSAGQWVRNWRTRLSLFGFVGRDSWLPTGNWGLCALTRGVLTAGFRPVYTRSVRPKLAPPSAVPRSPPACTGEDLDGGGAETIATGANQAGTARSDPHASGVIHVAASLSMPGSAAAPHASAECGADLPSIRLVHRAAISRNHLRVKRCSRPQLGGSFGRAIVRIETSRDAWQHAHPATITANAWKAWSDLLE